MHFVIQQFRNIAALDYFYFAPTLGEIFHFLSGIPKGFKAFLKIDGEFAGKGKRTEIFLLLLMYWPEIEEMRKSQPPKTRRSSGMVGKTRRPQLVEDDKIFFAICDDIDLDMTVPGHPCKSPDV